MDAEITKEVERIAFSTCPLQKLSEYITDCTKCGENGYCLRQRHAKQFLEAGYGNIMEAIQCVLLHAAKVMNAARWSAEDNGKAVRLLELVAKVYGVELYESDDKYCKGFVFYLKEAVEPLIKLCGNDEPMAQKICRNETENDEVDEFVCSACGLILQEFQEVRVDEDDGEETRHQFIIRYCPQCGAKVVDDD